MLQHRTGGTAAPLTLAPLGLRPGFATLSPEGRGDAGSDVVKRHAPIPITRSPTTPIRHFPQTYLRCFPRRVYCPDPPPTRTDVDGERRGGWTGRRGGI